MITSVKSVYLLLFFLISIIGCCKKDPVTVSLPPTNNSVITFACRLDTIVYINPSDSLVIYSWYSAKIEGNYLTLDEALDTQTDSFSLNLYLSNDKLVQKTLVANWGWFNHQDTVWIGVWYEFAQGIDDLAISDTTTIIDSLVVYYLYWRNFVRYGPYKNKHANPPMVKYIY